MMSMTRSSVAIIPARGGSKRIPRKNVRPFLGRPLILWTIEFAVRSGLFDKVVVTTDDEEIAGVAADEAVEIRHRPPELASDFATSASVVEDVLDSQRRAGRDFDIVGLLQPTTPVRLVERWQEAFELTAQGAGDAAIGVAPVRDHPMHVFRLGDERVLEPWLANQDMTLRSQDLPQALAVNGSLYMMRTQVFTETKTLFPIGCRAVICEHPIESIDIDTEWDWQVAESMVKLWNSKS